MNITAENVPEAFFELNKNLSLTGFEVDGYLEFINAKITIKNPRQRVATVRDDPVGFVQYMGLQWAWYAHSKQDTALKEYYPEAWHRVTEGDVNSNYGQYVWAESQFHHCITLLGKDPNTRRAVIMFNRREVVMSSTNDHICTTSLQFLIRHGRLYLITTMRSNELHFGFRTDVVFFTMLQEIMATLLGLELGDYCHNVGSLHVKKEKITGKHVTLIDWPKFDPMELADLIELKYFFSPCYESFKSKFELTTTLQDNLKFFKS
jgi:thymidylate synthase